MEVYNQRSPRWPSYQGKRKRYQGRPQQQQNQREDGHQIPMEVERRFNNFRSCTKFRGSFSNRGRNSLNEQRQTAWDYKKNSRTFPPCKRRRKEIMLDEYSNQECMQDEYINQDGYGHYKKKQRYEEGKASNSNSPVDPDLVMADSKAEHETEKMSNDRNLKVYESIIPHLGMRRYEESEASDAKSSVSFFTWHGDCESMDIDCQYVDARLIADLNDIQNKMVFLDVKKDDISLGSLFL